MVNRDLIDRAEGQDWPTFGHRLLTVSNWPWAPPSAPL